MKNYTILKNSYGLILIGLITLVSIGHVFYFLHHSNSFTDLLSCESCLNKKLEYESLPYKFGFIMARFFALFAQIKSLLFAVVGLFIFFAEFNYRILLKPLFISRGIWGKFTYGMLMLILWIYLSTQIYYLLPEVDQANDSGYSFGFSACVVVFSFIYAIIKYSNVSFRKLRTLNYEKTKAELSALKAQINPHFLFNVLNNIYGTAIIEDSPKTAEGIQQLSRIMRHVVEETKTKESPIHKEIDFIRDYLKLQMMRVPNRPNISILQNISWDGLPNTVAPLLFVPYIENAFKYGISVNEDCFIRIALVIKEGIIEFSCDNSITKSRDSLEKGTGTGLENTRKRLALHYPEQHQLSVENNGKVFKVKVKVEL